MYKNLANARSVGCANPSAMLEITESTASGQLLLQLPVALEASSPEERINCNTEFPRTLPNLQIFHLLGHLSLLDCI